MRTVGILYPGDMGHNVARVLLEDGFSVVTTLVGRSDRTRHLSNSANIKALGSLVEVVGCADVILSINPAWASYSVAKDFIKACEKIDRRPLYVDANAISPMTVREIGADILSAGAPFLDACIVGPAPDVRNHCVFYASGEHAQMFRDQLGRSLRIEIIGPDIGQASAFKMVFSGVNKGLMALIFELTIAAKKLGFADEFLNQCRTTFPAIMNTVNWLAPSYSDHGVRRAVEMKELVKTLEHYGLSSFMAQGAHTTFSRISSSESVEAQRPNELAIHEIISLLTTKC